MRYMITFFLTFLTVVTAISAMNWFVDPYGMYWSPAVEGINMKKPASGSRVRITKAYRAPRVGPEVLLVGNSRVEMGLSPVHSAFIKKSVYNMGLPGASFAMQLDYALNTVKESETVTHVLLGLDFVDFLYDLTFLDNWHPGESQASYERRLAALTFGWQSYQFRLKEKAALVFSLDSLFASVQTMTSQGGLHNSIGPRGQNTAESYKAIIATEGIKPLFVQKLHELELRLASRQFVLANNTDSLSPSFAALTEFLDLMHARGIKVDLFINPYHFSYVMLLDDFDLLDMFHEWKALLVERVKAESTESLRLWDFSAFNSEVLEPLPRKEKGQEMAWFWEPAHYREQLGNKLIDRIMSSNDTGFGERLTEQNLRENIEENRRNVDAALPKWLALKRRLDLLQRPQQ